MKTKILKLLARFLLLLPLCAALLGAGCEKDEDDELYETAEGYIVGSFQCNSSEIRNFCIILENNRDSLITSSLSEDIFNFPAGIIKSGHNSFTGGPFFFPDSFRYEYKIRFKFRVQNEDELVDCPLAFNTMGIPFSWENWNQAILTDVRKPLK